MRLILVRHGQTAWNEKQVFRGRADIPLDETGIRQAQSVGERLAGLKVERIYSSRLKRAWKTAQIIANELGIIPNKNDNLIDFDFGDWEGLGIEEVQKQFPDLYGKWLEEPHKARIPGGEDLDLVKQRIDELLDKIRHCKDGVIGIVSHRVILKVLLCSALDLDLSYFWRFKQDVAAISILDYKDGRFSLSLLNDTCHLNENKELGDF